VGHGAKPPEHVLAAFGARGPLEPLPGGTGRSWRAGDLVLKPLDRAPHEIPWQAEVLGSLACDGFRVAPPLREIVDGWTAWRYVAGRHEPRRWREIIAAGERLHAALAHVARPDSVIEPRTDPWEVGDRVAWGEAHVEGFDDLLTALRPVAAPSSLVHGDLTGNVLFHGRLPPAIIDFAPYWRPREYAAAIVVADALVWEDAPAELATAVHPQLLLRALIYRAVTSRLFGTDDTPTIELARRIARCASR
jgi:uncharacterized protein (TIGR02569 family)